MRQSGQYRITSQRPVVELRANSPQVATVLARRAAGTVTPPRQRLLRWQTMEQEGSRGPERNSSDRRIKDEDILREIRG